MFARIQKSFVIHLVLISLLLSSIVSFIPIKPVLAAPITVTNTNDSGGGSLRQAITNASVGDTIIFNASLAGQTIMLASTLVINKNLTIDGSSLASKINISGNNSVGVIRVTSGSATILKSLIVKNGSGSRGGGIENSGMLNLENCNVLGNSAYDGGGIYNNGTLTVTNCDFSNNSARNYGGGIRNYDGTLTILDSTFSNNNAQRGGGLKADSGNVSVTNSMFVGNSASQGGGVDNNYFAAVTISSNTFFNNTASSGGGIYSNSSGGPLTVTNSTFANNEATDRGGGIYNGWALVISNSTLHGNNAATLGGGIFNNILGTLTMNNDTFSENSAYFYGGGIYNWGTLYLKNNIVANSVSGGDCYNNVDGTVAIAINNLIESNGAGAGSNLCGVPTITNDPNLGLLADNGGSTYTMALLPGSPAIDTGNDGTCAVTDQRGVVRPQGTHCDIGAFELDIIAPIVQSITLADPSPTSASSVDFTVTFSEPVTDLDSGDFALTTTGTITGATINSVTGSGPIYTVTVNTGTGDGTLRLDVPVGATITDLAGNPLGGLPYISGQFYMIDKDVDVYIGSNNMGNYVVASTSTYVKSYANTMDGPVRVVSTDGLPLFTSQRAFYGNSFNELMGYPADQFTTEYWFPWYDNIFMQTWILVGNPSTTDTAEVEIYIGGQLMMSPSIPPNGRVTPMFGDVLNGPVRVVCINCASYGGTIFASERSLYGDSFSEVMGYPDNQLTTEYWFPWYDNIYMQTWILVGNPSSTQTAYVDIYIGGAFQMNSPIPPDGRITPMFAGQLNGPVQVVSTTGAGTPTALPIFASERSLYGTSFNEVMGYPKNQFTTNYSFPWYDNTGSMQSWVLVGNPSATQTAYVEIYIGGTLQLSTSIPPNGRITPTFPANTGPVRVLSVTGTGTPVPIDIFTSERSLYLTSFNEMMGYPADQLTTEYWFTWYDNVFMNTDILISQP